MNEKQDTPSSAVDLLGLFSASSLKLESITPVEQIEPDWLRDQLLRASTGALPQRQFGVFINACVTELRTNALMSRSIAASLMNLQYPGQYPKAESLNGKAFKAFKAMLLTNGIAESRADSTPFDDGHLAPGQRDAAWIRLVQPQLVALIEARIGGREVLLEKQRRFETEFRKQTERRSLSRSHLRSPYWSPDTDIDTDTAPDTDTANETATEPENATETDYVNANAKESDSEPVPAHVHASATKPPFRGPSPLPQDIEPERAALNVQISHTAQQLVDSDRASFGTLHGILWTKFKTKKKEDLTDEQAQAFLRDLNEMKTKSLPVP